METSSLPYWNERWGRAPAAFATSWPDEYARALELLYVKRHLPAEGTVVEIGCGNFQLAEDSAIPAFLCGRYLGIDGSPVAVAAAEARGLPGLEFQVKDLTKELIPAGSFILSKRFLQNLHPDDQCVMLRQAFAFPHGLLIEDFMAARAATSNLRYMVGRGPLEIPEFNWPLQSMDKITTTSPGGLRLTLVPFMGWFYAITRVFPDLPRSGFDAAFALSQRAILKDEEQPFYGPVIAIRW